MNFDTKTIGAIDIDGEVLAVQVELGGEDRVFFELVDRTAYELEIVGKDSPADLPENFVQAVEEGKLGVTGLIYLKNSVLVQIEGENFEERPYDKFTEPHPDKAVVVDLYIELED